MTPEDFRYAIDNLNRFQCLPSLEFFVVFNASSEFEEDWAIALAGWLTYYRSKPEGDWMRHALSRFPRGMALLYKARCYMDSSIAGRLGDVA